MLKEGPGVVLTGMTSLPEELSPLKTNEACQRSAQKEQRSRFRHRSNGSGARQRRSERPFLKSRWSCATGYLSVAGSATGAAISSDNDPVIFPGNEIVLPR